jgi:CubicO group peptidase (beta-lactamase class C family)
VALAGLRSELVALVQAEMGRWRVPGVALGVVQGDEELVATFGVTNVEHPLAVTPSTLFQVGSTTKTMTATLVMRRAAAGALDLDAPLRRVLAFALADEAWAERVTPRHLLTHTAGWAGDYFLLHRLGVRGDDALARVVERLPEVPLQTPPGETFAYSNLGFAVLGRAIEVLAGAPYDRVLAAELLGPLGMHHTFLLPEDAITERVAVGHRLVDGTVALARPWAVERAGMAHGGVISDLRDQIAYLRFQLGLTGGRGVTGAEVLAPRLLDEMQRAQTPAGSICDAFGLGWQLTDVGVVRTVRHGGETNGQLSEFVMVPPERFGFTILTNAVDGASFNRSVTAWLLERALGVRAAPIVATAASEDTLRGYVGRYAGLLKDVVLTLEDGALVLRVEPAPRPGRDPIPPPAPVRLALTAPDRVAGIEEPALGRRGEFLRDVAGRIEWLRWDGRLQRRADAP